MEKHGSESYFVVDEGLLSDADGDAPAAAFAAAAKVDPPFRFSRMGPKGTGKQLGDPNLRKLGNAMTVGGGGRSAIPAGFTYLGQFIDHDLTFDKTKLVPGKTVSPAQMLQNRSPALDLDSLYGMGPQEPDSAKFFAADGVHLKTGKTEKVGSDKARTGFDLPRGAGKGAAKRTAVIPDPRNDENLAVAQTHCAMIRFHNRVVDTLPKSVPQAQRFAKARALVTKHYQWMIRTDYLTRICDKAVVDNVFDKGRKVFEVDAKPLEVPTMPIEFSIAAFRLGHSMIRAGYNWNARFDDGSGSLFLLFIFSAGGGDLGGSTRLPSNWIADFRRLYDFSEVNRPDLVVPSKKFNMANRIDTLLADPLRNLPPGSFGGPNVPFDDPRANLATRNLERAKMVKLATGQQMVKLMKKRGVNVTPLTKAQIRDGKGGASLDRLTDAQRAALLKDTPLWFYILREAELNSGRLKGVGARIVAETFHRAIEGSESSILRGPKFTPTLGAKKGVFRMTDLLLFAFEGQKGLLAPLG